MPAKKVTIANVPPFISDDLLVRELSGHGKVVSPIRKLSSGCSNDVVQTRTEGGEQRQRATRVGDEGDTGVGGIGERSGCRGR